MSAPMPPEQTAIQSVRRDACVLQPPGDPDGGPTTRTSPMPSQITKMPGGTGTVWITSRGMRSPLESSGLHRVAIDGDHLQILGLARNSWRMRGSAKIHMSLSRSNSSFQAPGRPRQSRRCACAPRPGGTPAKPCCTVGTGLVYASASPRSSAESEPRIGVRVADWRIRRMKTRRGTCNAAARRIWLNPELAKEPLPCLEYVVVHEMAHLVEPSHQRAFSGRSLDRAIPGWSLRADELNRSHLPDKGWEESPNAD